MLRTLVCVALLAVFVVGVFDRSYWRTTKVRVLDEPPATFDERFYFVVPDASREPAMQADSFKTGGSCNVRCEI